jgi:serine/threonine protein kinase
VFLSEGSSGLTTSTPHTGTERYLAPELLIEEDGDPPVPNSESDIYALGCVGLKASVTSHKIVSNEYELMRVIIFSLPS